MNTIQKLFLFAEQLDQLEVWQPCNRLLTGIPLLAVFQNLRWNSNKTRISFLMNLEMDSCGRGHPSVPCGKVKIMFMDIPDGPGNGVDRRHLKF